MEEPFGGGDPCSAFGVGRLGCEPGRLVVKVAGDGVELEASNEFGEGGGYCGGEACEWVEWIWRRVTEERIWASNR